MSLFDASSSFGRLGNDIFDNTKIGKGYNTISDIASKFQDAGIDKAIQDTGNQFGGTEVKYPNGIFSDDTNKSKELADAAKNPMTPLIAPIGQSSQQDLAGFRPPPGSGIWGIIKDVIGAIV